MSSQSLGYQPLQNISYLSSLELRVLLPHFCNFLPLNFWPFKTWFLLGPWGVREVRRVKGWVGWGDEEVRDEWSEGWYSPTWWVISPRQQPREAASITFRWWVYGRGYHAFHVYYWGGNIYYCSFAFMEHWRQNYRWESRHGNSIHMYHVSYCLHAEKVTYKYSFCLDPAVLAGSVCTQLYEQFLSGPSCMGRSCMHPAVWAGAVWAGSVWTQLYGQVLYEPSCMGRFCMHPAVQTGSVCTQLYGQVLYAPSRTDSICLDPAVLAGSVCTKLYGQFLSEPSCMDSFFTEQVYRQKLNNLQSVELSDFTSSTSVTVMGITKCFVRLEANLRLNSVLQGILAM